MSIDKIVLRFGKTRHQKTLILYICVSSTTEMIFIKKTNILHILLAFVILSSCNKEKKKIELSDDQLPKNTLPKMKPLTKVEPKLNAEYINSKKQEIDSFYIVAGMAIDKVPGSNQYNITAELINIMENREGKNFESLLLESEGDSVFDAVNGIMEL